MLHIYAALAQKERALISERTKAALQAAKFRYRKGIIDYPDIAELRRIA
jgi:DNA invertase Pin-like site-specific DNA recombinase